MAKAGYLALMTDLAIKYDAEYVEWDDLKKRYKEVWEEVARSVYAVIAVEGGADVEEIDPDKENTE